MKLDSQEFDYLGSHTGNAGRLQLSDGGKTHSNWVSPRLQLYFWPSAGKPQI